MANKIVLVTKVGGGTINLQEAHINLMQVSGSGAVIRYRAVGGDEKLVVVTEAASAIETAAERIFPVTDLVTASLLYLHADKVVSFSDVNSKAKIIVSDGANTVTYMVNETSAAVKVLINAL